MKTALHITFTLTLGLLALVGTLGILSSQDSIPAVHANPNSAVRYVATSGYDDYGGYANNCTTNPDWPMDIWLPCRTIQYAVDVSDSGDEILVATGIYTDVHARPRKDITTTSVVTQVVYISKTVTIRGGYTTANWAVPYPITQPVTLDAQGRGRVLYLTGYHTATLEGLQLAGGNATGLGGDALADAGGGVYIHLATATISNCQVFSSTAGRGGGFYLSSSRSMLSANTISTNTAPIDGGGGGLFLYQSAATLNNNTIVSNTAAYNGGGIYLSVSNATLDGNTIARNAVKTFGGGGLYVFSSDATVINNLVTGNTANRGGGLTLQSGAGTLRGNTVVSNSASARGGGMHLWGSLANVSGNTVMSNTATDAAGGVYVDGGPTKLTGNVVISNSTLGYGGGFYLNGSSPSLNGNTIAGNTAEAGGGLHLQASAASLNGNTISANHSNYGGGFYIYASTARLAGNAIISNVAQVQGGGLCMNLTSDTLINNVVADNFAKNEAAGLLAMQATPRLLHNTIARNTGGDGSGIYVTNVGDAQSAIALTNTILVSQTVGITVTQGNTATLNGVLWHGNVINYDGGGVFTVTNAVTGDPAFAADDYHLTLGSKAIDAGIDAGITDDIDGDSRPFAGGPDLGADEYLCYVRLNDDPTLYPNVQAAVDASASPADIVKVAGTCRGVPLGGYSVAYITKTLTLRGGYSADFSTWNPQRYPATLDALAQGTVIWIDENISPTVETLRLTNGATEGYGGGLYAYEASPTISGCVIYSNTAHYCGGGISLEFGSEARLLNNQIYSNTAANAGGVYLDRSTNATLIGNQIFGNLATPYSGYGGGLALMTSPGALLVDNRVYRNTASKGVGGIWLSYITNTTLINTVIADN